jgi:hypothetical protein
LTSKVNVEVKKLPYEHRAGLHSYWQKATYNEIIHHSQQNLFIVFRDLVYFTIYFSQIGHLELIYTMYKILGRKLTVKSAIKINEISFLHKIVIIHTVKL